MSLVRISMSLVLKLAWLGSRALTRAQEQSCVGKTIIVKEGYLKFARQDEEGRQVFEGTLDGIDYRVLDEQGRWIRVRQDDEEG